MTAERITPCQFEEVLKQYGTPNETILKAQIKLSLQRNFDRQNDAMMRRQLFDYLFETIDVPVSSRIVDEHFVELCKKEEGENELNEEDRSKLLKKAKEIAKKRVIVACYQKKFNIYINEQDVQQQICDIAESRRVRPEEIKEEFVSGGKMDTLAALVKEKKIFKHNDPEDLVAQAIGANHQYPDGLVLLTGTMFAPIDDRDAAGEGFTHHEGDVVTISSARLGALVNTVAHCDKAPPWEYGLTALMRNLARRGLLS